MKKFFKKYKKPLRECSNGMNFHQILSSTATQEFSNEKDKICYHLSNFSCVLLYFLSESIFFLISPETQCFHFFPFFHFHFSIFTFDLSEVLKNILKSLSISYFVVKQRKSASRSINNAMIAQKYVEFK